MSNTNTNVLNTYRTLSIMSIGIVLTITVLIIFFPIFSGNFYYQIGTIMIFNGKIDDIPKGWALCDGLNNTPDLTNKFIVGAWSSDIPIVESNNNDTPYIGPGMNQKYMNNPDLVKKDGVLGLIGDNTPFTLGQSYVYNESDHIFGYDQGTNWVKKYKFTKRNQSHTEG